MFVEKSLTVKFILTSKTDIDKLMSAKIRSDWQKNWIQDEKKYLPWKIKTSEFVKPQTKNLVRINK